MKIQFKMHYSHLNLDYVISENRMTNNSFRSVIVAVAWFAVTAVAVAQPQPYKEEDFYRLESLPIPEGVVLEVGGLELLPDGRLAASSRRGEIWMFDKPFTPKPEEIKATRFAHGLHEVLGIAQQGGWLYATQRCEVSRLKDTNNDGVADLFETVSDGWEITGDYHEYAFGSPFDRSLARDGVVLFVALHRALDEGSRGLGRAQQRDASRTALGVDPSKWKRVGGEAGLVESSLLPLRAGVVESGDKLVALNRPLTEDAPSVVANKTLEELFTGLEFRHISDALESEKSLTSEVWRTFLWLMAAAIIGEALLCMPGRRAVVVEANRAPVPSASPAAA